jgi:hypothetical protein
MHLIDFVDSCVQLLIGERYFSLARVMKNEIRVNSRYALSLNKLSRPGEVAIKGRQYVEEYVTIQNRWT